jgi:hypothetical protein
VQLIDCANLFEINFQLEESFFLAESPLRDSAIRCSLSDLYPLTDHCEAPHIRLAGPQCKTAQSYAKYNSGLAAKFHAPLQGLSTEINLQIINF